MTASISTRISGRPKGRLNRAQSLKHYEDIQIFVKDFQNLGLIAEFSPRLIDFTYRNITVFNNLLQLALHSSNGTALAPARGSTLESFAARRARALRHGNYLFQHLHEERL